MRWLLVAALAAVVGPASAADHAAVAERALGQHILPGFERFAAASATLAEATRAACAGSGPIDAGPARAAYHAAFDAWAAVGHLRFGPTEEQSAGYAIAFWPDSRGATPRALAGLIATEDPVVYDLAAFRGVSVAARGLFALDQLLFDPDAPGIEAGGYSCRLLNAIAADLAGTAATVFARWRDPWGAILTSAGAPANPLYFAPEESTRELYSALNSGLQATIDLRLGRPLGTFEKPAPRRAEAWRSRRSLRNVALSLEATRAFAETAFLPELDPEAATRVRGAFDAAIAAVDRIGAPISEAVATPQWRLRAEAAQQAVERLRDRVAVEIGAAVGVDAGFNSMDGD